MISESQIARILQGRLLESQRTNLKVHIESTHNTSFPPTFRREDQAIGGLNQSRPASQDSAQIPSPRPSLNVSYFRQFENRTMDPNHVEYRLGDIRQSIKLYDEFIRGKDIQFTSAEDQDRLKVLDKITPFCYLRDIREETTEIFGRQSSRLVVLWRNMFNVQPTVRLRDELIRLGPPVEYLDFSSVFCGSLAYLLLHAVFYETDRLRDAERRAGLRSCAQSI